MTGRNWIGEALAAFDQSIQNLGQREGQEAFGDPSFWIARAQAAATLASAEQARLANLIAWKQLQASRAATRDGGVDLLPLSGSDEITDEIERGLGILTAPAPASEPEGGDL